MREEHRQALTRVEAERANHPATCGLCVMFSAAEGEVYKSGRYKPTMGYRLGLMC